MTAARLESGDEPYYVLKEPQSRSYLRLSEADYALWWRMDGQNSIKDLLYYSLLRYRSLPIGHLNQLVDDLRAGRFLQDRSTNLYGQIETQLDARAPASRGRRLLEAFLHTELARQGLDPFFSNLYRVARPLFLRPVQITFITLVLIMGGLMFARLVSLQSFALSASGIASVVSLILADVIVIGIHELAHGLTTKHFGRGLDRGGFLLYWGMPAFFVDTRDIWMSPKRARILVSWAGPHSGLLIGGLVGIILTAVFTLYPEQADSFWAGFLYQMGFLAYLSVLINLNPLLELDGYFILIDWLDMPGLRERALHFWRQTIWSRWGSTKRPRAFWDSLERSERIFVFFGGLTLIYSVYALLLALYFWRTRLLPLADALWNDYGAAGEVLLLLVAAGLVAPAVYYLASYVLDRSQAGLAWLSRRDLLARPDVLALLLGTGIVITLTLSVMILSTLPRSDMLLKVGSWLLHLAAMASLAVVARQVSGSRFQWVLWSLVWALSGLTLAWIAPSPTWRLLGLAAATAGILASGIVAWFVIWPSALAQSDRLLMGAIVLLGAGYALGLRAASERWLAADMVILFGVVAGLILMVPLWINFWRSRFALPWFLIVAAILMVPVIHRFPRLHLPGLLLWLYGGLLYLLLGVLAQFERLQTAVAEPEGVYQERDTLVSSFNHFMQALFASYQQVFGGRRLQAIQQQVIALGPVDPDDRVFQIAQRCQAALTLAVDRLDDLAGEIFTRKAGSAAYDSLPWLEAETLARHVLSADPWGATLAQGFIRARNTRFDLIRQAALFSGLDDAAVEAVLRIAYPVERRSRAYLARAGQTANCFYLVESGQVGVYQGGEQKATLTAGGYFGTNTLLGEGNYRFTYRVISPSRLLVIERDSFDPLLRSNILLSERLSAGAEVRRLLQKMPLFGGLSPQQLAAVDAQLKPRTVVAGEIVVRQGQPRSAFFIVADGRIEILQSTGSEDEVVGSLGPGEHFGEYALFADTPYFATYRAAMDSRLYFMDESHFDQLVAACNQVSAYVEQLGSGRLIATRRRPGVTSLVS